MYTVNIYLEGQEEYIKRQAVYSVMSDLKSILFLDKDIRVMIESELSKYVDRKATLSNLGMNVVTDKDLNSKIKIEVEEEVVEETILSTRINQIDYLPVMYDEDINFIATPLYIDTEVTMNIDFTSKSRSRIESLIQQLRTKVIANTDANFHTVKYRYLFNRPFTLLLIELYEKKVAVDPEIGTMEDWLINISDERVTIANGQSGSYLMSELAAHEEQLMVVGWFDSDLITLKPEFDEETNSYKLSLSYKFKYNKLHMLRVTYPIVVYNQVLNSDFVAKTNYYTRIPYVSPQVPMFLYNINNITSEIKGRGNPQELYYTVFNQPFKHVLVPDFDNWIAPRVFNPLALPTISILLTYNPDDEGFLFNLGDLGNFEINPILLDFFKESEYPYMTRTLGSIFTLTLYENNEKLPDGYLSMDENLNVYNVIELDIKKTYHCTLDIIIDVNHLKGDALNRFEARDDIKQIVSDILDDDVLEQALIVLDPYERAKYMTVQTFNVDALGLIKE